MPTEDTLKELAMEWVRLYNEDHVRLVNDLYTDDLEARAMGLPVVLKGKESLITAAGNALNNAPGRQMRIERILSSDQNNVAIIEAVLTDPERGANWQSPCCVVLTLRGDRVVSERTYLDKTKWPGLAGKY